MSVCSLTYPTCKVLAPYFTAICFYNMLSLHIISKTKQFSEQNNYEMCFDFFYNSFLIHFPFEEFSKILS